MATLILSSAGAAVGTALGGPIGAVVGRTLGAVAGAGLDGALSGSGPHTRFVAGPRLADVPGLTSTEGDPIPRVYGRARIGGSLIWATRPLEVANTTVQRAATPAKGMGGAGEWAEDRHHPLHVLRQPRGRAVRGGDRLPPPDLGGRPGDRSGRPHHPGPHRRAGPGARPADRRQGGG
jgi:hypothetical protein